MSKFIGAVRRITDIGMAGGAGFLVAMMALTVANVIYRFFGGVIQGTYELTGLMMAMSAGFALAYVTLKQRNVVVQILSSRFSKRVQAILQIFNSIMGIVIWGLIAWVTTNYLFKRGFVGEGYTETLGVPYFPAKCIWVIALTICTLVFVVELIKASSQVVGK